MTEEQALDFLEQKYLAKLKDELSLSWASLGQLLIQMPTAKKEAFVAAVNSKEFDKLGAIVASVVHKHLATQARSARNQVQAGGSVTIAQLADLL